jgi:dCMP deaminase
MVNNSPKNQRPSWDDYFLELADAASRRATCDRGKSGCVIVRDKQVLATGYVGAPAGLPHCDDAGHLMKKVIQEDGKITEHCVRTVHAEQNAICQAAKRGISIEGATVYQRMTPCRVCAMMYINCGIKKIVCERKYQLAEESEQLLAEAGIELVYKYDGRQEY